MAIRIDVLGHLPGFHKEYTKSESGKTKNVRYVSEDGKINLSTRQAQEVAHGKKSLTDAIATSIGLKKQTNRYKVPISTYEGKDFFALRDLMVNNPALAGKKIFISVKGDAKGEIYQVEGGKAGKGSWTTPLPISKSWNTDKYWERMIDRIGETYKGDPSLYTINIME